VLIIKQPWDENTLKRINDFLVKVNSLLATNEVSIKQTDKNKRLRDKYGLRHEEILTILKSLTAADCIEIRKNDNPRYPDADIFIFIKDAELFFFGEPEIVKIYIKEYIVENKTYDQVIVISFHEEGEYD